MNQHNPYKIYHVDTHSIVVVNEDEEYFTFDIVSPTLKYTDESFDHAFGVEKGYSVELQCGLNLVEIDFEVERKLDMVEILSITEYTKDLLNELDQDVLEKYWS